MKRLSLYIILILALTMNLAGCVRNHGGKAVVNEDADYTEDDIEEADDIPILNIGYIYSNHQAPLIIAASKGEEFRDKGVYLEEVEYKEEYILISGDERIARISMVAASNGEEITTKMTRGELHMGLTPIKASLVAVDKNKSMKVLGPIQNDSMGLVMPEDSPIEDFPSFLQYIRDQDRPTIIGYHSPMDMPVILFKTAMEELGIMIGDTKEDGDADILLKDLKGTANLIPALESGLVDGLIASSPFPELAQIENVGKLVLNMADLSPSGKWQEFPCCVVVAMEDTIEDYPKEMKYLFKLLAVATEDANRDVAGTGKLVADWIGVSEEAVMESIAVYSMDPNNEWLNNIDVVFTYLQKDGVFKERLKNKGFKEIKMDMFNFDLAIKALNR